MTDKDIESLKKKALFTVEFSSNNKTQITDSQIRALNQELKQKIIKSGRISVMVCKASQS